MAGKTRFKMLEDIFNPYVGQLMHIDKVRLLMIRNMGTSGTSIANHLRFAQEAKLIHEEEPFMFRILNTEISGLEPYGAQK